MHLIERVRHRAHGVGIDSAHLFDEIEDPGEIPGVGLGLLGIDGKPRQKGDSVDFFRAQRHGVESWGKVTVKRRYNSPIILEAESRVKRKSPLKA